MNKYFYLVFLFLIISVTNYSQTDSSKLITKFKAGVGFFHQNKWNINELNRDLNTTEIINFLPYAKLSYYLSYKKYIGSMSVASGGIYNKNQFTNINVSANVGHKIFHLNNLHFYLTLNYSYSAFRYILNYLDKGANIFINNTSGLNGGTIVLSNKSSLTGVSFLFIEYSKNRKINTVIELSYLFGISDNKWTSDVYNMQYNKALKENLSVLILSVGF